MSHIPWIPIQSHETEKGSGQVSQTSTAHLSITMKECLGKLQFSGGCCRLLPHFTERLQGTLGLLACHFWGRLTVFFPSIQLRRGFCKTRSWDWSNVKGRREREAGASLIAELANSLCFCAGFLLSVCVCVFVSPVIGQWPVQGHGIENAWIDGCMDGWMERLKTL